MFNISKLKLFPDYPLTIRGLVKSAKSYGWNYNNRFLWHNDLPFRIYPKSKRIYYVNGWLSKSYDVDIECLVYEKLSIKEIYFLFIYKEKGA